MSAYGDGISRGDNTGIRVDADFAESVIAYLYELGCTASYEYPGVCVIQGSRGYEVWTGMHDWDYGSWLDKDRQPIEDDSMWKYDAEIKADGSERNLCARAVARRWHAAMCRLDTDLLNGTLSHA